MKALLPIGSVVLLKGGNKRLIIVGIIQTCPEDGIVYDYMAYLYPEGFVGLEHNYLFNHDDIDRIEVKGFTDNEHDEFRSRLAEFIDNKEAETNGDVHHKVQNNK